MKLALIILPLLAAGCVRTIHEPVVKDNPVEVKVAVSAPCMGERPGEPVALRDRVKRADWDALTTDQREAHIGDQALGRKVYGDQLTVAAAGCKP